MSFYNNFYEIKVFHSLPASKYLRSHKNLLTLHQNLFLLNNMAKLNRIKTVLAEQEKTSKWLAEQVGKSACTVSKWCGNSVQPDLKTLNEIANALSVDVKDLLVSNNN